jgi:cyclopropane fatty-acyl-phospholipid synthase-like methyltransferase
MIDEAGLGDKVDLRLMDYRDLEGRFDKIVSIEMFEAVGKDYWPTYFAIMSKVLKKGGRAVIQSITIDHAAYHSYAISPILSSVIFSRAACCHHCQCWNAPWRMPDCIWLAKAAMPAIMRAR